MSTDQEPVQGFGKAPTFVQWRDSQPPAPRDPAFREPGPTPTLEACLERHRTALASFRAGVEVHSQHTKRTAEVRSNVTTTSSALQRAKDALVGLDDGPAQAKALKAIQEARDRHQAALDLREAFEVVEAPAAPSLDVVKATLESVFQAIAREELGQVGPYMIETLRRVHVAEQVAGVRRPWDALIQSLFPPPSNRDLEGLREELAAKYQVPA